MWLLLMSQKKLSGFVIEQLFNGKLSLTTIFSNNQSAITLAKDHQYHAQMKHIDIHYYFLQWIIERGVIQLIYYLTEDMVADTPTKVSPFAKVKHFVVELRLSTV